MFKRFYNIFSIIQFDKIVELKSNSDFELIKTNKNSKEKKMKVNKVFYQLFTSKLESKRYDVEIFNQQAFEDTIQSNSNLIRLEDLNQLNQQKRSVLAETSRLDQKSSSSSSLEINEQTTSTLKKLRFLSTFRISHSINSKFDQSNILSERVKRKNLKSKYTRYF